MTTGRLSYHQAVELDPILTPKQYRHAPKAQSEKFIDDKKIKIKEDNEETEPNRCKAICLRIKAKVVSHRTVTRMLSFWSYGFFQACALSMIIPQTAQKMDNYWSPPDYNRTITDIKQIQIVEKSTTYGSNGPYDYIFETESIGERFFNIITEAAFLPSLALGGLLGGIWGDMYGPRPIIHASLTATGITALTVGLLLHLPNIFHLIGLTLLAVLGGIFSGGVLPNIVKVLATWQLIGNPDGKKGIGIQMALIALANRIGVVVSESWITPMLDISFEFVFVCAAALSLSFGPLIFCGMISSPTQLKATCHEYPKEELDHDYNYYTYRPTFKEVTSTIYDLRVLLYSIANFLICIVQYKKLHYNNDFLIWGTLFTALFVCALSDKLGRAPLAVLCLIIAALINISTFFANNQFIAGLYGILIASVNILLTTATAVDLSYNTDIQNIATMSGTIFAAGVLGDGVGGAIHFGLQNQKIDYSVWMASLIIAVAILGVKAPADFKLARLTQTDHLPKRQTTPPFKSSSFEEMQHL